MPPIYMESGSCGAVETKPLICLRDLSNYRERSVPETTSEIKADSITSPMSPVTMHRPQSTGSNTSGVLPRQHSPQNSFSTERSPSPSASPPPSTHSNSSPGTNTVTPGNQLSAQQQLPPACGARQLSKLKRFLTTLIQFGTDISPEIGERVRSLVLALVNNHLSIEEFHSKLQEATNFPLRPFVIPFLKTNLPLLQRELLHCARMARQTPQQYLAHNEHVIFDPSRAPPLDTSCSDIGELNENGKRLRSPERYKENGFDHQTDTSLNHPSTKRAHTVSPTRVSPAASLRSSPATSGLPPVSIGLPPVSTGLPPVSLGLPSGLPPVSSGLALGQRISPISAARESGSLGGGGGGTTPGSSIASGSITPASTPHRLDESLPPATALPRPGVYPRGEHYDTHLDRVEDEWKHMENMLHCVMDMVTRCRQSLQALQERTRREREELSRWVRLHNGVDPEVKKRADYMSESLRHAEDRVSEMRRRAVHVFPEEAVAEVKRQAMQELQKAVEAAEAKTHELVAAERSKMQLELSEAARRAREDAMRTLNTQCESSESCWNCGRKASETCSGCNTARYCGAFCQHKDWESHHRVCGQSLANQQAANKREQPIEYQEKRTSDGNNQEQSFKDKPAVVPSDVLKLSESHLSKSPLSEDNPGQNNSSEAQDDITTDVKTKLNDHKMDKNMNNDLKLRSSPEMSRSKSSSPTEDVKTVRDLSLQ